jgi:ATP-dependent Lon protease
MPRARSFVYRAGREEVRFAGSMPLLPLRDVVLFPGMMAPLLVGRPASVAAVEHAVADDKIFAVLTQRDPQESDPTAEGLHEIGTVVRALQLLRTPDGTLKLLVEGVCRFRRVGLETRGKFVRVRLELAEEAVPTTPELEALSRRVVQLFQEYVSLHRRLPDELASAVENVNDPAHIAHAVSGHLLLDLERRQSLLSATHPKLQLELLSQLLGHELEILRLERKIEGEVRTRVSKGQKEFYLQEQLKAIRKELGESVVEEDDAVDLRERVLKAGMPKEVEAKALGEVDRLKRMSGMSPEATVVRSYVATLVSLPWKERTRDRLDLARG